MTFFSTLTDLLESALESVADGINKIADAIPSPSDSSSSNRVVSTSARDALRLAAEKESAIAFKSFFQKHQMTIPDAQIDALVRACSASPNAGVYAAFERRFEDTAKMCANRDSIDVVKTEIDRLEDVARTLRSLSSKSEAALAAAPETGDARSAQA